jgi:cysteinyl-tRNA synthetase
MKLYNTLTRKLEIIKPINPPNISLYTCGPTVYDYTHIGHMRAYVINDLLKRTLDYCGFKVKRVMNITDVGHLTGDDDTGVDKLEKGAKKSSKTVWEVVKFFTDYFFSTTDALNILRPDITCKATDHIKEMIELIKKLQIKGFTYETGQAVYYDVTKFKKYGKLSGQKIEEKIQAARKDVNVDPEKKHPVDFALWFKRAGRFADHTMHWMSPWGDGFPGWHIECSAMSMKYLGESIDIHTGGIDHIPVHHENEIAQSEGATGKPFVKIWFHNNFLMVDNQKMSKSLGNIYKLEDLKEHEIEPLAVRYLFLQSHYRQLMNFTWESAKASQDVFNKLKETVIKLKNSNPLTREPVNLSTNATAFKNEFVSAILNDLQTPQAVATMWDMLKSDIDDNEKYYLLMDFDKVFGLKLNEIVEEKIPKEIIELAEKRRIAKKNHDYTASDTIRDSINSSGYKIEDSGEGYKIKKI